jgi:hypothetical protein
VLGHFLSLAARRLRSLSLLVRITIAFCFKLEFWRRALKTNGRILVSCWTR